MQCFMVYYVTSKLSVAQECHMQFACRFNYLARAICIMLRAQVGNMQIFLFVNHTSTSEDQIHISDVPPFLPLFETV